MQYLLRRAVPLVFGMMLITLWASTAIADTFCTDVQKILAASGDFGSLKGEAVEGERFKATTEITGFRQCTVIPFRNTFSYTCETAPEINQGSALQKWNAIKEKLDSCLKGNWMQRSAGKNNAFFADRKKGEAMSLSSREVAGFKRVGNQLKTFPTYYNRLSIFPRKKMRKTKAN